MLVRLRARPGSSRPSGANEMLHSRERVERSGDETTRSSPSLVGHAGSTRARRRAPRGVRETASVLARVACTPKPSPTPPSCFSGLSCDLPRCAGLVDSAASRVCLGARKNRSRGWRHGGRAGFAGRRATQRNVASIRLRICATAQVVGTGCSRRRNARVDRLRQAAARGSAGCAKRWMLAPSFGRAETFDD